MSILKQNEPTEEELQKINDEIEREFLEKGDEAFSDEKKEEDTKVPFFFIVMLVILFGILLLKIALVAIGFFNS